MPLILKNFISRYESYEGCAPKWQLAYFGPKDGYFGHFFKISTSNLFCP